MGLEGRRLAEHGFGRERLQTRSLDFPKRFLQPGRVNLKFALPAALCFFPALLWGQLANQPPVPQWLPAGEPSVRFDGMERLLKAILFVAGDAAVKVSLNGHDIGTANPGEVATTFDVTSALLAEKNVLRLVSNGKQAALLELNGDLARKRWIVSDGTWTGGKPLGLTSADPEKNPFDFKKTFDAYNSWKLAAAGTQSLATDPATIQVPQGFRVELVRSSQPGEDSWVSMAFDLEGRITLGMEKKGLLRLTVSGSGDQKVERINDTLLECRGLLYAHGALYANANNSKGLYRLRDAGGDGVFDESTELLHTEGGVGHGRNHIKLGPDGRIWIAHGNNVQLPKNLSAESPLQNYADDQLLPNPWDGTMFDGDVKLPAGHILSMNPDGSDVRLVAGGMRNPLDIAFNKAGELFTFDADMERDVGTPWYMPTRVLHVVPGADFGWRRGTGRWPAWYPDTLPSVVDIGLASPTGVFFGYESAYPEEYQKVLFILDWSYGRIIAVKLGSTGSSYVGKQETFISGRPLNVTDGAIGPDGAMWFTTGGRGTQSGLYRVVWEGGDDSSPPPPEHPDLAVHTTKFLDASDPEEFIADWHDPDSVFAERLVHPDPHARFVARWMLERIPVTKWSGPVFRSPQNIAANIVPWVAIARTGDDADRLQVIDGLLSVNLERTNSANLRNVLRVLELAIVRCGPDAVIPKAKLLEKLAPLFPKDDPATMRQLTKLLVYLRWSEIVNRCAERLPKMTASEDLLFYPFILRYMEEGWTLESRRAVFVALNRAEKMNGASTYFKAIADTRSELAAQLTPAEAEALADEIAPPQPVALASYALPAHTFKVWTLADLLPLLPKVSSGRSYEGAKQSLISSQCVFCHRVIADASLPAGVFGPDLSQVSARFGRRDLLDHILNPSKIIDDKFRFSTVTKSDGTMVTGLVESEDDERITLKPNPLAKETVEIGKSQIRARKLSDVSPMPAGLLNALKTDQILDMLAWFEAGGKADHGVFKPKPDGK